MRSSIPFNWKGFGSDLAETRKQRQLNIRQFAEKLGLSHQIIMRAEEGRPLTAETFSLLCKSMHVNPLHYLDQPQTKEAT